MSARSGTVRLGFMSALQLADGAWSGGLLITTQRGRPLEFQCTSPVRPNRSQEILYGPTLKPFLIGEVIAKTLLDRSQVKPQAVLTDCEDILEVASEIEIPIALLAEQSPGRSDLVAHEIVGTRLHFVSGKEDGAGELESLLAAMPTRADLCEPFERVRDALGEALKLRAA